LDSYKSPFQILSVVGDPCTGLTQANCTSSDYPTCAWCSRESLCMSNETLYANCTLCVGYNQTLCNKGACVWDAELQLCIDTTFNQTIPRIAYGNFETGTLQGWTVINGNAWTTGAVVRYTKWTQANGLSGIFNQYGVYFASSFMATRADTAVGEMHSTPFMFSGILFFRLGGGLSNQTFVSLVEQSTGNEIQRIYPFTNTFFMTSVVFNVTNVTSVQAYIRVVDNDTQNSIGVDGFFLPAQVTPARSIDNPKDSIFGYVVYTTKSDVQKDCWDLFTPIYCTYNDADAAGTTCITTRVATGYCALCACCYSIQQANLPYSCQTFSLPICLKCKEAIEKAKLAFSFIKFYEKYFQEEWAEEEVEVLVTVEDIVGFCELFGVIGPEGELACDFLGLGPGALVVLGNMLLQDLQTDVICYTLSKLSNGAFC